MSGPIVLGDLVKLAECGTAVVVSTLTFAYATLRLEARWRARQREIEPYREVLGKDGCPKCGAMTGWEAQAGHDRGPKFQECRCERAKPPHVHVVCLTCKSKWLMAPADAPPSTGSAHYDVGEA